MSQLLRSLCAEDGQDMVEYALLLSFVVITALAVMLGWRPHFAGIWAVTNRRVTSADTAAGTW